MLSARNYLTEAQTVRPIKATKEVLADVHTKEYIDEVHSSSWKVAEIVGLAPIAFLPSPIVKRCLISPMRYHVAGTMVAAALALENGWSINLGGGMHHAHRFDGDGESGSRGCTVPHIALLMQAQDVSAHVSDVLLYPCV
jgi:histone deacetylase 11